MEDITIYALELDQEVSCYHCSNPRHYPIPTYRRGEAFLCGPEHTPYNAEANYICLKHLDPKVKWVYDPVTNTQTGIEEVVGV